MINFSGPRYPGFDPTLTQTKISFSGPLNPVFDPSRTKSKISFSASSIEDSSIEDSGLENSGLKVLFDVEDTTGLVELANVLLDRGYVIFAAKMTLDFLDSQGVDAHLSTDIERFGERVASAGEFNSQFYFNDLRLGEYSLIVMNLKEPAEKEAHDVWMTMIAAAVLNNRVVLANPSDYWKVIACMKEDMPVIGDLKWRLQLKAATKFLECSATTSSSIEDSSSEDSGLENSGLKVLFDVEDTTGLVELANVLLDSGYVIFAAKKTLDFLDSQGVDAHLSTETEVFKELVANGEFRNCEVYFNVSGLGEYAFIVMNSKKFNDYQEPYWKAMLSGTLMNKSVMVVDPDDYNEVTAHLEMKEPISDDLITKLRLKVWWLA